MGGLYVLITIEPPQRWLGGGKGNPVWKGGDGCRLGREEGGRGGGEKREGTQTDLELLSYIEDELLLGQAYFEGFTDKRAAAKYSSTLYKSKGTKYSIQQFFRTFFNVDPDVVYTKRQIFNVGESIIGAESQRYLTDDKLYQQYALLIKTELSVAQWRKPYKLFVHPAGMYLVSEVQLVGQFDLNIEEQPFPGLKDISELIGVLPVDQQMQSINIIMESIGLMPAIPQVPAEPDFITGIGV